MVSHKDSADRKDQKVDILFLFNQMVGADLSTGGDVYSYEFLKRLDSNSVVTCTVSAPKFTEKTFAGFRIIKLGDNYFDKTIFDFNKPFTYIFSYVGRIFESRLKYNEFTPDYVFCAGDFISNTLPAYFFKRKSPHVKIGVSIFHLNKFPLYRRVPFIQGLTSFILQRISFLFIKKSADYILVLTDQMKNELVDLGFPKHRIIVTWAGIDVDSIGEYKKTTQITRDPNSLVFFNRLNYTKGIYDLPFILSRISQEFPKVHLHLIGSYSDGIKSKLGAAFEEVGCLDKVTFHGFLPDMADVYSILFSSSVILQPSYEEGWGIALLEAILCGCLPVTYDLPVYGSIFGEALHRAPLGDKNEFSCGVKKLLALSDADGSKLRNKLQKVAGTYSWDAVFKRQCEIFSGTPIIDL